MKTNFKKMLVVLLCMAVIASVVGCGSSTPAPSATTKATETTKPVSTTETTKPSSTPEFTMKFGHSNEPTPDAWFQVYALKFEELIESYSNGRIAVDIYPSSQLGDEMEMFRSVSLGTLESMVGAATNFVTFAPSLGYFTLPYMFESTTQSRAVIKEMLPWMQERSIEEAHARVLGVADAGFRVLSTKEPVRSLADIKPMKIRVPQNAIMIGAYKSWDVGTVPLGWSETYTALQQNLVDGQDNPYNAILAARLYEVQKYITDIDFLMQANFFIVSDKFYTSLPEDLQAVVDKVGLELMDFANKMTDEGIESDKKKLQENGMELLGKPTDMDQWISKARSIWPEFYKTIGAGDAAKGEEIVKMVEAAKAKVK